MPRRAPRRSPRGRTGRAGGAAAVSIARRRRDECGGLQRRIVRHADLRQWAAARRVDRVSAGAVSQRSARRRIRASVKPDAAKLRRVSVQLAWCWLRWQPDSALRSGSTRRFAGAGGRSATHWHRRAGAQTGDRAVALRGPRRGARWRAAETDADLDAARPGRALVTLVRAARLPSGFLREPSYRWSGAPFGPAHACSWCVTVTSPRIEGGRAMPDFPRTGQCEWRVTYGPNNELVTGAASASSLLGRSPLRRELARTLKKAGGLTTDSLIEGGPGG